MKGAGSARQSVQSIRISAQAGDQVSGPCHRGNGLHHRPREYCRERRLFQRYRRLCSSYELPAKGAEAATIGYWLQRIFLLVSGDV